MTDPDLLQGRLHGIDLNRLSASDCIGMNTGVIKKDSSPIPYSYIVGNKNNETSLNNMSGQV